MTTILLVEDDRAQSQVYEMSLTNEGYDVVAVYTCADAIEKLTHLDVSLVVLDMNLPDAPGTEVLDYIESEPALMDVLTIVLTAYTRFINQSNRSSVLQMLNKPVTGSMLVRTVKTALTGSF